MTRDDLREVMAIERASFPAPWTEEHFRHEIEDNPVAINLILRHDRSVVGYLCAHFVSGELQINDLAVDPAHRRRRHAGRLLDRALAIARAQGGRAVSLEVRPSNAAARRLYATRGFEEVGRRTGYYSDSGEDAILLGLAL